MNKRIANGEVLQRSWSGSTEPIHPAIRLLLLSLLGLAAVVLHAGFHWPLKLPGHHGLEWMAILVFGRCWSRIAWAGSATAASAAVFSAMPIWGFSEPLVPLFYFLPGIVLDLGYRGLPMMRTSLFFLGAMAAVAHASKPVVRYLISALSDLQFGSLTGGLAFPLTTHLVFGFCGGIAGALAWKSMARRP